MIIGLYSDYAGGGYLPRSTSQSVAPFFGTLNLAVRRKLIDEIGGFDEALPIGEDIDLCIRAHGTRWRMFSAVDARVEHFNRPTITSLARQWYGYGFWHAALFKKYCRGQLEILVWNPSPRAQVRYAVVMFRPRTVFHGLIFVSSLLCAVVAAVLAGIGGIFGVESVVYSAGLLALVMTLLYLRDDLRGSLGLRDRLVVTSLRLVVNLSHLAGAVVGGIRVGFPYVCGTLWKGR